MSKKKISASPVLSRDEYVAAIQDFRLPRYAELPEIELYMDQMLSYIGEHVELLLPDEDKGLTAYMVNNYVKQGLVPKPKSKRYLPEHVAYLIVVTVLKQSFSFPRIMQLIRAQISLSTVAHAYDLFCTELEAQLRTLFCEEAVEKPAESRTRNTLLISAVASVANKIYAERTLSFVDEESKPAVQ